MVHLRVNDGRGAAIAGASCSLSPDWRRIYNADPSGIIAIPAPGHDGTWTVRASGYETVPVFVSARPTGGDQSVVLRPFGVLEGIAADPGGNAVGPGIRLLAVSVAGSTPTSAIQQALEGRGPLHIALTDENGRFRVEGLAIGGAYRLYAGGAGLVSVRPFSPPVVASATGAGDVVRVRMQYAYGVWLEVRDQHGQSPALSPLMRGRWFGTPRPVNAGARLVPWSAASLLVLGPDAPLRGSRGTLDRSFLFASDSDLGAGVDLDYRIHPPGYAEFEGTVRAERARGHLLTQTVLIERVAAGFGDLEVTATPVEAIETALVFAATSSRVPEVVMRNVETGVTSSIDLREFRRGYQRLTGIPFGRYAIEFRSPSRLFVYPGAGQEALYVTIGHLTAEFEVRIGDLGSLEVDARAADGTKYAGPIAGSLVGEADGASGSFALSGRPYLLPLLPSGSYSIDLLAPSAQVGLGKVVPGVISAVGIELERSR